MNKHIRENNKKQANMIASKNKLFKQILESISSKEKFKLWIKTLLSSMKVFPEIIKALDNIIDIQATTISFMTDIYNSSCSTFNQAEQIIDLTERKQSVLNIYLMIQNIIKSTNKLDQEFLIRKFVDKLTIDELAEEYNVSPRTVYRKTEKIIEDICRICLLKNWSLKFIESQVQDEDWLFQNYKRNVIEFGKSSGIVKGFD